MNDGGKGSKQRPMQISQQEWDSRWDAIFGRDIQVLSEQEVRPTRNNQETQEALEQSDK